MKYPFLISLLFCLFDTLSSQNQDDQFQNISAYWQQEINYKINVTLDDTRHMIMGDITYEYVNNSPDTLHEIFIHLWPNAFATNKTPLSKQLLYHNKSGLYFAEEKSLGFIDSLDFSRDGIKLNWYYLPGNNEIAAVELNASLHPNDTLYFSTPFRVKVPKTFSRLGHINNQYQFTQWYPKPAVYDREGWHCFNYLDIGEFYAEFGSFNVAITLPENYIVGATGKLMNETEQLFLDSIAELSLDEVYRSGMHKEPESSPKFKTITYYQDSIHDFAWFADKRYLVKRGKMKLPETNREIELLAMYNVENEKVWEGVLTYMKDAVNYFSLWIGEYPYSTVTVVDGALSAGAGMEYPTITIVDAETKFLLDAVVTHEIGHNWLYGVIASNERKYPWLDEGLNTYYEKRYLQMKYPNATIADYFGVQESSYSIVKWLAHQGRLDHFLYDKLYEFTYLHAARQNYDQPVNLDAPEYSFYNYGAIVYYKSALAFEYLQNYMGVEKFDLMMHEYFNKWKFKHPMPDDFKEIVLKYNPSPTEEWFFNDMISTTKKLDYAVMDVDLDNDTAILKIKNKGDVSGPLFIQTLESSEVQKEYVFEGFKGTKSFSILHEGADEVVIDFNQKMPELHRKNNQYRLKGPLNAYEPVKPHFLGAIESSKVNSVYYFPLIGTNTTDNFLAGVALYNNILPKKNLDYYIAPMYSSGLNTISGKASIHYSFFLNNVIKEVKIGGDFKKFSGFTKLEPNLSVEFKKGNMVSGFRHAINASYNMIQIDTSILKQYPSEYEILSLGYKIDKKNAILDIGYLSEIQINMDDFYVWKNSLDVKFKYLPGEKIKFRIFHGIMKADNDTYDGFSMGLSGGTDYLMDYILFDRAQVGNAIEAYENQIIPNDGGFKEYVPVFTNKSLTAFNVNIDIPHVPVVGLFADMAWLSEFNRFYSDAGIVIKIIPDIFEFYMPIHGHGFENNYAQSFNEIWNNTRFVIHFEKLNPFSLLKLQ